jgi:serine/threonine protein kinase
LLKRGKLDENGAKHLLRLIKTTLKSQTIQSVRFKHAYVFGESIDTGAGKAIIQKVISLNTGCFLCAKVFLNYKSLVGSHSAVFEFELSQTIGSHENIAPIVDSIQFSHESGSKEPLMALLMPLYNWSLAELLVCFNEEPLPLDLFKQIARGLLAAGAQFQAKSFSHCDIKPNNVMMNGLMPVVIDFGAVVPLGSSIVEHTPFYAMDANHDVVTSEFDLFCIVTTLVRCFVPMFELKKRTKEKMILR